MKNIILASDFSENARKSIVYAIELFEEKDVQYTLLNVFMEPQINEDILITIKDILEKRSVDGLQKDHAFIHEQFPNKTIEIDQLSIYGRLPDVVNSLAETKEFNYVVMGKKGGATNLKIGAITKSMVQKSKTPVLIIPEDAKLKPTSKIFYSIDIEADDSLLIHEIQGIAEAHNAYITMLPIRPNTSDNP
ncbi:MAG: nucleotide-binding universal stress UspA family protein [Crocinitomicaceae bacterium]|jgi:nucleotide-binding universal stress UspA family protein